MAKGNDNFNVNKIHDSAALPSYYNATDALANRKHIITFYHVNTDHYVAFKAFIMSFTETYTSDWASEVVYGRTDPIYMFKNTTRKLSLTFKVPAATVAESYENLGRVQKLLQFLYPNYSGLKPRSYDAESKTWTALPGMAHANTISGAPLVRLQVMNLARRRDPGDRDELVGGPGAHPLGAEAVLDAQPSMPEEGLLGAIGNVNINHNLEGDDGVFEQPGGAILPKMIEVTIDFSPIHESHLGWFENGTFGSDAFPYGAIGYNGTDADYYAPHNYSRADADCSGLGNDPPDSELPIAGEEPDAEEPPTWTSQQQIVMAGPPGTEVEIPLGPDADISYGADLGPLERLTMTTYEDAYETDFTAAEEEQIIRAVRGRDAEGRDVEEVIAAFGYTDFSVEDE